MATHIINKINCRLRFLYRQNKFFDISLRRLLRNVMIQPLIQSLIMHVTLGTLTLKRRLQTAQN